MTNDEISRHVLHEFRTAQRIQQDFFHKNLPLILETSELIAQRFNAGGKILICGNGGSASDAQHFAGELVGRFLLSDRQPLPAIALNTDTSTMTAIANDFGYDQVFSRQVIGLANEQDLLFAISTSGNSPNILRAVEAAKSKSIPVIGLTGNTGGKMAKFVDIHLNVASGKTSPHIQETHIMVIHTICDLVEQFYLSN